MARFRMIPDESQLWIEARSSLHPIHGEVRGLTGDAEVEVQDDHFDLAVPPKARLELPVEKLTSGNALQDMEMQRRIDARRHPVIVAELRGVTPLPETDQYRFLTDLNFHGVTRRFEVPVTGTLSDGTGRIVIESRFELDVRGYDVTPPRFLGLQVYPEIQVKVRLVLEPA